MSTRTFFLLGAAVCLVLAFAVSRHASSQPDGLEKVAADEGFEGTAEDHALGETTFADYGTDGVDDEGLGTGIAGVLGVGITFLVAGGAAWAVTRRPRSEPRPA